MTNSGILEEMFKKKKIYHGDKSIKVFGWFKITAFQLLNAQSRCSSNFYMFLLLDLINTDTDKISYVIGVKFVWPFSTIWLAI